MSNRFVSKDKLFAFDSSRCNQHESRCTRYLNKAAAQTINFDFELKDSKLLDRHMVKIFRGNPGPAA